MHNKMSLAALLIVTCVAGCGRQDPAPVAVAETVPSSPAGAEPAPAPKEVDPAVPNSGPTVQQPEPMPPSNPPAPPPVSPPKDQTYEGKPLKVWVEVIRTGSDSDARTACKVVGLLGVDALPALREMMKDRSASVRDRAAFAVGEIGDDARIALPDVIALLRDPDAKVRESAARALGEFTVLDQTAVGPLVALFSDDIRESFAAAEASAAVAKVGKAAVGPLTASLRDSSRDVRNRAAKALGLIGSDAKEAIPQLIRLLKTDRDTEVRREAAMALGRIGADTQEALEPLIELVKSRNKDLLLSAIIAIGDTRADSVEAVECLVPFLSDPNLDARLFATDSLGKLKSHTKLSVDLLKLSLRHRNEWIRYSSAIALASRGNAAGSAADELSALLPEQNNKTRVAFAYALGRIAPKRKAEATKLLLEAVSDSDFGVRLDACERIIALNPDEVPESVPLALAQVLKQRSRDRQKRAAIALGLLGSKAAVAQPALLDATRDNEKEVRKAASDALSRIEQSKAAAPSPTPDLTFGGRTLAEWVADLKHDREAQREAAAKAIGGMGAKAKSAAPQLIPLVKDKDALVRKEAILALGLIGADDADTVRVIAERLADSERLVRPAAARSLGRLGKAAAPAVPELTRAASSDDSLLRPAALDALGALGAHAREAIPVLLELASGAGLQESFRAKQTLKKVGKGDLPLMLRTYREGNATVKSIITGMFEEYGPDDGAATADLLVAMKDDGLWAYATGAIKRIGPGAKDAIEPLKKLLNHDNSVRRITAAAALASVSAADAPQAVKVLVKGAEDEQELAYVRVMAIESLGELKGAARESLPVLKAFVNDPKPIIADAARKAVAQIEKK